jgi:diaminopimelate epimerase
VELGTPRVLHSTVVSLRGRSYEAGAVDTGNPHAVALVDSLVEVGELTEPPEFDADLFPNGVNVEFVEPRGEGRLAMRVYERGVGETASCGTGAVAAAAGAAAQLGNATSGTYLVEVRGGVLSVTLAPDGCAHLKGPAVLVAEGTWTGTIE